MSFHRKGRKYRKGKENHRRERERAQSEEFQADLNCRFFLLYDFWSIFFPIPLRSLR
jgi:hypothetical protein